MPAKSKAQQHFFGLVKSVQDGDTPKSKVGKSVKDAAKSMSKKEVDDFAKTKTKNLPKKVKKISEERIDQIISEAIRKTLFQI